MHINNNITPWQFIADKFSAGIPLMLLYVLQSKGSSPGRQGFKMAVAADNHFCGTIGGGIMEYKFVEMARSFLQSADSENEIYRQVHDKSGSNQSGMICSGEQTIFLYRIKKQDIISINAMIGSVKALQNGTLTLTEEGISFSNEIPGKDFSFSQNEKKFILQEKTGFKNTLHIIGGGHCTLALSKLMSDMDFLVNVYDDRENLNTLAQNSYSRKKTIVSSYADIGELIKADPNTYVVIMTFGYRTDDLALRALIGKEFKYIGVLGSGSKMEKIFADYRKEKISEKFLKKIHAPIGLYIKSQTTAEIAVSIAAEIIKIKNEV